MKPSRLLDWQQSRFLCLPPCSSSELRELHQNPTDVVASIRLLMSLQISHSMRNLQIIMFVGLVTSIGSGLERNMDFRRLLKHDVCFSSTMQMLDCKEISWSWSLLSEWSYQVETKGSFWRYSYHVPCNGGTWCLLPSVKEFLFLVSCQRVTCD